MDTTPLLGSATMSTVLEVLVLNRQRRLSALHIASMSAHSTESVGRALRRLSDAGVAERGQTGWRLAASPQADAIRQIAIGGGLLARRLRAAADRLPPGAITHAFVFGSIAAGTEYVASDLDLLIVGGARLFDLGSDLRDLDLRLGRELNTVVISPAAVADGVLERRAFFSAVWSSPRIALVGTLDSLPPLRSDAVAA